MPHRIPCLRELVRTFFADYLRLVEPDSAVHLRLDRATLLPLSPFGEETDEPETAGVLAEVPTRRGEKVTILVLLEPEALGPADISRRLSRWFMDLEIRYAQPVLLSVLYLQGGRPGVTLEAASICKVMDMEILRIFFTAFGVAGSRAEYFLERPEPVAWALSALMRPLRHGRARHKWLCRQRIAAAELPAPHRDLLAGAVDAFLELDPRETAEYRALTEGR